MYAPHTQRRTPSSRSVLSQAAKSKISKWLSGPSSASAGSVPKALAGLYLRETPSNGLAMMRRSLDYPLGGSGTKQYGAEFGMILGGVDDGGGGDCVGGVSGTKKTAAIDTSQEREGGEGGLVEKGGAFETGECSSTKADGGDAPGGDAGEEVLCFCSESGGFVWGGFGARRCDALRTSSSRGEEKALFDEHHMCIAARSPCLSVGTKLC